jgi:hypothetical protein
MDGETEIERLVEEGDSSNTMDVNALLEEVRKLARRPEEFHGLRANYKTECRETKLYLSNAIDELPEQLRVVLETLLARDMDALLGRYLLCVKVLKRP